MFRRNEDFAFVLGRRLAFAILVTDESSGRTQAANTVAVRYATPDAPTLRTILGLVEALGMLRKRGLNTILLRILQEVRWAGVMGSSNGR